MAKSTNLRLPDEANEALERFSAKTGAAKTAIIVRLLGLLGDADSIEQVASPIERRKLMVDNLKILLQFAFEMEESNEDSDIYEAASVVADCLVLAGQVKSEDVPHQVYNGHTGKWELKTYA